MQFDLFEMSLAVAFWIPLSAHRTSGLLKSMAPTKLIFLGYKEGFYPTKRPFTLQLGPLELQSEADFQKVSVILSLCDFMKPVLVEKYFDVGRRPQTIAWHAFAVKPIVNRTMQLD